MLLFLWVLLIGLKAQSPEYFEISDPSKQKAYLWSFKNLDQWVFLPLKEADELNLLDWIAHWNPLPRADEPYNRRQHFGRWIRINPSSCLNTRHWLLLHRSQEPVTVAPSGCRILTGRWYDPFSNQTFLEAKDVEVDHMVPLKHAWDVGAFRWNKAQRCAFANFVYDEDHLVIISITENRRKGARGPDGYLPSHRSFWCEYLAKYLRVKQIWELPLLPQEALKIQEITQQHGCPRTTFVWSLRQWLERKHRQLDLLDRCEKRKIQEASEFQLNSPEVNLELENSQGWDSELMPSWLED